MNPEKPTPGPAIRTTTVRDAIVAALIGIAVLGFVGYGVMHMSKPVQGNKLTGVVVEKQFTPLKEQIVEFSGNRLKGTRESDGEYVLKVRVDAEGGRVFEVPVPKSMYEAKAVGESLTFVRPPSEQK
jgi:hypothetical protein